MRNDYVVQVLSRIKIKMATKIKNMTFIGCNCLLRHKLGALIV